MFWSKIWFFVIAILGAVALTVALILPKPAERQLVAGERQRIVTACDVVNILLRTHARRRIDLAGQYARAEIDVSSILGPASARKEIPLEANKTARPAAADLMEKTDDAIRPRFTILVDNRGRVVARAGLNDEQYGDSLAGYALVTDAIDGYLRDDLWVIDRKVLLMSGSPVIGNGYVGAVILGHALDKKLADQFVAQLGVNLNFYAAGDVVAASNTVSVHKDILAEFARVRDSKEPIGNDCRTFQPFTLTAEGDTYTALLARLPGEAGEHDGAFFAVYIQRPRALGVIGTLRAATSGDLSFGNFPWLLVGLAFVAAIGVGIALFLFEHDRPLRRLAHDTIALAKGQRERLEEQAHRGKLGSLARSVNIRLDKLERDIKDVTSKSNLDDLLGPAPVPLIGSSPSIVPPGSKPPLAGKLPPSEFRFSDSSARSTTPPAKPPAPPVPAAPLGLPGSGPEIAISTSGITAPPPIPQSRPNIPIPIPAKKPTLVVNGSDNDEVVFRQVFDQFMQLKIDSGESTESVTFERFAKKLRSNRDALMAKHGCQEVGFQVYIKDGKASLKATPIKV